MESMESKIDRASSALAFAPIVVKNSLETLGLGNEPHIVTSNKLCRGVAKSVKAPDFDSGMRRFESFLPCH